MNDDLSVSVLEIVFFEGVRAFSGPSSPVGGSRKERLLLLHIV